MKIRGKFGSLAKVTEMIVRRVVLCCSICIFCLGTETKKVSSWFEPAWCISDKELSSLICFRTFSLPILPWYRTYIDISNYSDLFDEELKTLFKHCINLWENYNLNLKVRQQFHIQYDRLQKKKVNWLEFVWNIWTYIMWNIYV